MLGVEVAGKHVAVGQASLAQVLQLQYRCSIWGLAKPWALLGSMNVLPGAFFRL